MPTYLVGTTRTYNTIQAAVNAIPSSLSGTGVHDIIVDAGVYNENITISKSSGSAVDYIHLHAAFGSEHSGVPSAGVRIVDPGVFSTTILTISTDYTRVTDIIANHSVANNLGTCFKINNSNCTLTRCMALCAMAGSTPSGFRFSGSNNTFITCLAMPTSSNGSTSTVGFYSDPSSHSTNTKIYNCGVFGLSSGYAFGSFDTNPTVVNCWSASCTTQGFASGFITNKSNNYSTDSSATGTGSAASVSIGSMGFFNAAPAGNFHITSGSLLRTAGTDLSSIFTTDIDGTTIAGWMVGPDFAYGPGSIVIGTSNFPVRPWPAFSIRPSILWVQDSAGYWNGSDRGSAQDAYDATAIFHGRESAINALEQSLELSREAITLSNFAAPLFSPNVDHTGSITAVVLSMQRRQVQLGFPVATSQIYELEVRFRAIAPTLLATTPSLANLRLQDGFDASHSYTSPKAFTYGQTASYGDVRADVGTFSASFSQSTTEIQAILAYLLTTARANSIAFPTAVAAVVPYPWGRARGAAVNCKVKSFSLSRKNLNRWSLKITFVEAP